MPKASTSSCSLPMYRLPGPSKPQNGRGRTPTKLSLPGVWPVRIPRTWIKVDSRTCDGLTSFSTHCPNAHEHHRCWLLPEHRGGKCILTSLYERHTRYCADEDEALRSPQLNAAPSPPQKMREKRFPFLDTLIHMARCSSCTKKDTNKILSTISLTITKRLKKVWSLVSSSKYLGSVDRGSWRMRCNTSVPPFTASAALVPYSISSEVRPKWPWSDREETPHRTWPTE